MIASIKRRQLIAGCLVLVAVVWTIDMVTGGGAPQNAHASLLAPGAAAKDSLRLEPADRDVLEEFLFARETMPPLPPFERVKRDPFAPPPKPVADAHIPPASETSAPDAAKTALSPERFAETHRLDGVVFGPSRVALVNGMAVRVGQMLDGCHVRRIERDFVVFDVAGQSVELRLPSPHVKPPRE